MREGIKVAAKLMKMGHSPFCPWLDYLFQFVRDDLTLDDYYRYSIDWLRVSDALLVIDQRKNSQGVKMEIKEAEKLQIPIYWSIGDLKKKGGEAHGGREKGK
jgi:hypothetical protein